MKKSAIFFMFSTFLPLYLLGIAGSVSVTEKGELLKWEVGTSDQGANDYFVMFGSNLEGFPNGERCVIYESGSTFSLESYHIPLDATVEKAFLIWTAAHDPDNFSGFTNNSVMLSFSSNDKNIFLEKEIKSSVNGTMETAPSFEYEALSDKNKTKAFFTHRVDVTDFMKEVEEVGDFLSGDYTVKNLKCEEHEAYVSTSEMVSNWALFFVYKSYMIAPKNIYIFSGLNRYDQKEFEISGLKIPENNNEMNVTFATSGGFPEDSGTSDGLWYKFSENSDWYALNDICNPQIFNSVSSIYDYDNFQNGPRCYGGIPPEYNTEEIQLGVDVDTFLVKDEVSLIAPEGSDKMLLKMDSGNKNILTNFLVVSFTDSFQWTSYDHHYSLNSGIDYCSCSSEENRICEDSRPFYYIFNIENWGNVTAKNVTLVIELSNLLKYIPGTAEKLTTKGGVTGVWENIFDGGDKHHFDKPVKIADSLAPCSLVTAQCDDRVTIRIKVKTIENIEKNVSVECRAIVNDHIGTGQYLNLGTPHILKSGACPPVSECPEPSKENCGGINEVKDDQETDEKNDNEQIDDDMSFDEKPVKSSGCSLMF